MAFGDQFGSTALDTCPFCNERIAGHGALVLVYPAPDGIWARWRKDMADREGHCEAGSACWEKFIERNLSRGRPGG